MRLTLTCDETNLLLGLVKDLISCANSKASMTMIVPGTADLKMLRRIKKILKEQVIK